MEKFNRTLRGYDPEEVNDFLDEVINKVEKLVQDIDEKNDIIKQKDEEIRNLKNQLGENDRLRDKLENYEKMENSLNQAIFMAQKTSDQLKTSAHKESEIILDDAKKNASRIVNEALLRAEKIEDEASNTKRNITVLKRRLKNIIESQLQIIDDIDDLEL
ncbi:MAG: DivIVA domain-containing protein [Bacilli bacterium]|nr:DivIVA domain-containing protein [Bacilli bacterium]